MVFMGFDVEQFEEEISDEFVCPICSGVLDDPQTTHCDHLFCKACITDWLNRRETCPIDRCLLRACMLRPAPRAIRNLLSRLKIRCLYFDDGCPEQMKLEHYKQHISSCKFDPTIFVTCQLYCKRSMSQRDFKSHNCFGEVMRELASQKRQVILLNQTILQQKLYLAILLFLCVCFLLVDPSPLLDALHHYGQFITALTKHYLQISIDFLKL